MTPFEVDAISNGAKVHIYRRANGTLYGSVQDFSRFGVEVLETVRVHLTPSSTVKDVEAHKAILAAIDRHSR